MIAKSIVVFHADAWQSVRRILQAAIKEKSYAHVFIPRGIWLLASRKRKDLCTLLTNNYWRRSLPSSWPPSKLHDTHALGVVLLEIATWKTAKDHFGSAAKDLDLNVATIDKEEVSEKFLSIAKKSIPYDMGTTYMEAVIFCLDDTYRGHTVSSLFLEIFQPEIIEKLSAKQ
ncbi:hypothetical protein BPAE_0091g00220 [Botrytis paeoniae]|uniref:Uncharacterized protein n=1 Tax=Botrytis paeoniae TaxID=278948 RepID=A0A4Z1FJR9_9HELO|nr:hypothetical protein BPAE_0091g00220 [Botrytis paeoniae]